MKTAIRIITLAAASVFAAMSCQKETIGTQDLVKEGETIQVNINASLGDLVAADGTKATATSVVRLQWVDGDKVDAYCGETKISGTDGLTVTPSENGMFAKLTGEITATSRLTSGTSVITFVYSNGCTPDGLTFDLSSQDADIPFVAYGTLVYDGTATLTDKMVEFKFATSVMKIAATNLGGGNITGATISGINTKVTLTPDDDSETCGIAGSEKASIIKTAGIDASSDGTRAIITVGIVPDKNKGRNIAVTQTGFTNKGVITSAEIEGNKSYTTPASLFTCGTQGEHGYVLIAGTKWATQNLAVSESGKGDWKAKDGASTINVPGTEIHVVNGDYFQWGTHENYNNVSGTDTDKGLLVYTEFSGESFAWKKDEYKFTTYSPHYEGDLSEIIHTGATYKKYNQSDGIVTLTPSDDVARILWEGTWRMPTSSEFDALFAATYWCFDATARGYYVYAPQSGDAGGHDGKKADKKTNISGTYDNTACALLFFPAAGFGNQSNKLYEVGTSCDYWSSSFNNSPSVDRPFCVYLKSRYFQSNNYTSNRYLGYSVRPVSE